MLVHYFDCRLPSGEEEDEEEEERERQIAATSLPPEERKVADDHCPSSSSPLLGPLPLMCPFPPPPPLSSICGLLLLLLLPTIISIRGKEKEIEKEKKECRKKERPVLLVFSSGEKERGSDLRPLLREGLFFSLFFFPFSACCNHGGLERKEEERVRVI